VKICAGDTVAIEATGGDSYLWTATAGINNPSDSSQRVSPLATTTYYVSITRSSCVFDDSVVVIVHPKPNVVITPSAAKFTAPDEKITLRVSSEYKQYLWSSGGTNDSITITVPGTYNVRVIDTNGCSGIASIDIGADLPLPSVTLEVPDIQAAPGDHIVIPLNIISSNDLEKSGATEFRYTLRFNRSILAPLESILSSVSLGRERSITKTGTRTSSLTSGTLTQIEFIAALGDTTETTIYLDSFIWTNGKPINTKLNSGFFYLQGICPKGGDRLFSSAGYFTMSAVHPNPSNGITSVKYELLEPGRTVIRIIDMMGRQVMTIVDADQVPGQYHSTFDVSSLPNGIYKCVLQSATQMESHLIGVCR
jgi:hypothetical protein